MTDRELLELAALRQPWISVQDRLPEVAPGQFSRKVLAFWQGGDPDEVPSGPDVSRFDRWGHWQRANGEMDYHGDGDVTHWMPLPAPPSAISGESNG